MPNQWKYTIDIANEWKAAEEDVANLPELATKLATEILNITKSNDDMVELEFLAEDLRDFATQGKNDVNEFDEILSYIYDHADENSIWINRWVNLSQVGKR